MATRNSTGDRLARAVSRLKNRSILALYQTQVAIKSANHWLSAERRLYPTFAVLSLLALVLALPAIKADPCHPINRDLSAVGVIRG
ncbi:hypothetical protein [Pseudoxanthomonas sp. Root630]|uniref:hypothetical protein n=1 Tax=Pseudoxanthomonas sp. Root630 TaxID=1736574 RepID=UPI000AD06E70|nr:hypothetical protein [Pseudoxanthomonas sp. Root630]